MCVSVVDIVEIKGMVKDDFHFLVHTLGYGEISKDLNRNLILPTLM